MLKGSVVSRCGMCAYMEAGTAQIRELGAMAWGSTAVKTGPMLLFLAFPWRNMIDFDFDFILILILF